MDWIVREVAERDGRVTQAEKIVNMDASASLLPGARLLERHAVLRRRAGRESPPEPARLRFLLELASLADKEQLTFLEARRAVEEGRTEELLEEYDIQAPEGITDAMKRICGETYNLERTQLGIRYNGSCLLLAYAIRALEERTPFRVAVWENA